MERGGTTAVIALARHAVSDTTPPLVIAFAIALALLIHSAVNFNLQISAKPTTLVVILAMGWLTRWLGYHADAKHSPMAKAFAKGPADSVSQPQEHAGKHLTPSGTHV